MDSVMEHVAPLLRLADDYGGLYIALAIVVITSVVVLVVIKSSKSGRDTVLLLGLCDSGKTLLFSLLSAKRWVKTQTSIQENVGRYASTREKSGKSFKVVDLPGHERLRAKYLYKHKDGARGIIFMVDSVNFSREVRGAAEFLYDVFANKTMLKNKVSILIACNKQDVPTAKSCTVIKSQLEKELNALRKTRSAALLGLDDYASSKNQDIGKSGQDFEFSHMHPIKVAFCECSLHSTTDIASNVLSDTTTPPAAAEQKPKLTEIEDWLQAL